MANSTITTTGVLGFGPYALNFTLGILSRDHVKCRVNSEVDGLGDPVYRDLTWTTDSLVTIASGTEPTGSDEVRFIRSVPSNELQHDYTTDAPITEQNLDESNLQLLMLVHQFIDGRIETPISVDLDLGNNKIIRLAEGTDETDAVNYGQLLDELDNITVGGNTGRVRISSDDAGINFLEDKVQAGTGIAITTVSPGGNEKIQISADTPLSNKTSSTTPTVDNDETEGYSDGSRWYNLTPTPPEVYQCIDATEGAAVWIHVSFTADELDTMAFEDADDYPTKVETATDWVEALIESPDDKDYILLLNSPVAYTVTSIVTKCTSGTCTVTGEIDGTPLGGTANSASTSEQTQAHASANSIAAGQTLAIAVSSNSSCEDLSVQVNLTRVY